MTVTGKDAAGGAVLTPDGLRRYREDGFTVARGLFGSDGADPCGALLGVVVDPVDKN